MTAKQCRAFLEQWPELAFHDPKAGRAHAAEGLARVEQLGNPPELHARALAFMGSSLRPSDPHQALAFLDRSLAIYHRRGEPPSSNWQMLEDEADARRRASLVHMELAALGHHAQLDKAFDEADRAYKIYFGIHDSKGTARCQLASAAIHVRFEEFVPALRLLLPVLPQLEGIDSIDAAHNIKTALVWSRRRGIAIPKDLRRLALSKNIRLARLAPSSRRRWDASPATCPHGRRKKTRGDAVWRWNLGIFLEEERRYYDALEAYVTARADFAEFDMPLWVAEITLDIAPLYARFGRWEKVQQVAAAAVRLLGKFPNSAHAVAAYGLWAQAIEAEDHEHLAKLTAACGTALGQLQSAP